MHKSLKQIICLFVALGALAPFVWAAPPAEEPARGQMRRYEGKYHILYTDLPREDVLESLLRITAMAESYYQRTKGFSGKITKKLPFYLYSRREDYVEAVVNATGNTNLARSAGLYDGRSLRAVADSKVYTKATTWEIVQHEGFHQFVHMVISKHRSFPIWLNEGLAEYFGSAIWTGDNLVCGVIPDGRSRMNSFKKGRMLGGRLGQAQMLLKSGQLRPWKDFIRMPHKQWNAELNSRNYVQAWSMVHFLIHAEDGKYRSEFEKYIRYCARGTRSDAAFVRSFKQHIDKVEAEYKEWWLGLKDNPSEILYDRITVETLMGVLARYNQFNPKETFESAPLFFKAAKEGKLALDPAKTPLFWLPTDLIEKAGNSVGDPGLWELTYRGLRPFLSYTREDGTVIKASFQKRGKTRLPDVKVEIIKPQKESKAKDDRPARPESQPNDDASKKETAA